MSAAVFQDFQEGGAPYSAEFSRDDPLSVIKESYALTICSLIDLQVIRGYTVQGVDNISRLPIVEQVHCDLLRSEIIVSSADDPGPIRRSCRR